MKIIPVIFIILSIFIFSVLPQAVQEENIDPDLLSDLMSAADDTVRMIRDNLPLPGTDTDYISVSALKYNNAPSRLGILFGYMLTTRILESSIQGIAVVPEYSINQFVQQNTVSEPVNISYKLEGNIFRVSEKIYIGIHFIKLSDNTVLAASEKVLPLYPEILSLLSMNDTAPDAGGDIYEPNNDPSFATILKPGETITGLTLSSDDSDWFLVDLSDFSVENDFNSIVIETQSSLDTSMELYGPDDPYLFLIENDDGGIDSNASITLVVEQPGIYYIKVKGYYSDTTGSYTLASRFEQVTMDESEPNNYMEEAVLIENFDSELIKSFNPSGDEDWFYFNVETMGLEQGDWVIIETLGRLDTLLSVYDETGYELLYDDDSGSDSNARVELYINDYNNYYIKVSPYDYGTVGEYRLKIYVE